jgi:DNA-binding transcriptional MerR regulator
MAELVEQSGVPPRTIREYILRELLPRPKGNGPAAVYSRKHVLLLWAITRLRQDGLLLDAIKEQLATMSARDMARYKPAPRASEDAGADADAVDGAGSPRAPLMRATEIDELPDAPRWRLLPLLPGVVLMVRDDAAPFARKAVAEMLAHYGGARGS